MPFDVTRSPFVTFLPRKPNLIYSWAEGSLGTILYEQERNEELKHLFPEWSLEDRERVIAAEGIHGAEEVITGLAEIRKPSNSQEKRVVMLVAAQGFVTVEGVGKIERAMKEANELGVPIIHLNAITSADFTLEAEVGQIARCISDTMAVGCELTVPKVTYVLGEAASAGAHAGLHLLDEIHVTENAMLSVIRPEAAFEILRCQDDVARQIRQKLRQAGAPQKAVDMVSDKLAVDAAKEQGVTPRVLRDLVTARERMHSVTKEEVMLILGAHEGRYVRGMYQRGADSITIHTDELEKSLSFGKKIKIEDFLDTLEANWKKALSFCEENSLLPEIFLRVSTKSVWTDKKITEVLKRFYSLGLTGIRLSPESSTKKDILRIDRLATTIEKELHLSAGTIKICLSVESEEGINRLEGVMRSSSRVTKVVMGVRDFIHNLAKKGVNIEDRNFGYEAVRLAKRQLVAIGNRWRAEGRELQILFACASSYRDLDSFREEVGENQTLGADGVLVIGPDQVSWSKAIFHNIVDGKGNIQEETLGEIETKIKERWSLEPDFHKYLYSESYREIMGRIIVASYTDPQSIVTTKIADSIVQSHGSAETVLAEFIEHIFGVLARYDTLSRDEIYEERHNRLARLSQNVVIGGKPIDPREGKVYREIVSPLLDDPEKFEPVGHDLHPKIPADVFKALGRVTTMEDLLREDQEETKTPAGIVAGFGAINGTEVLLIVRDPDFIDATAGASTGAVIREILQRAIVRKRTTGKAATVVFIDTSAGGRVQEGVYGLLPSELAVEGIVAAKKEGIRFLHVARGYVLGSDAIGPYYQGNRLVVLGKDTQIGLAGERLVFASSLRGRAEFPPGFRTGEYHMKMGNVDALVDTIEELRTYLEQVLFSIDEQN